MAVISALGSPGASTVMITGTAAGPVVMCPFAVMPLLPMRSARVAARFGGASSSSDAAIFPARRHLSRLSGPSPLAIAAVIFGRASPPTVAADISRLSASPPLAMMIRVIFGWASLPTVPAGISMLSASSLLAMMIPVVFGWAYMPTIIAAYISLLSMASPLAMTKVVFSWASLPTVSAGLPVSR